jgi:phosphatidylserine/phosphatidylglycerophosphate/cardiolipin synthase-like enzyme
VASKPGPAVRWKRYLAGALSSLLLTGCGLSPLSTALTPRVTTSPTWVSAAQVAPTALRLLATAHRSVRLDLYELGNPSLVAALIVDHARGLSVEVILDATETQSQSAGKVLAAAGVPVHWMHVPHGIDHVKLLVIDGTTTLVGGVNWGTGSSDTTDGDVLFRDPAAAAYFRAAWAGHPATAPAAAGAWSGATLLPTLTHLIATATRPIHVAANYLTDWSIQDALAAAVTRGVPVDVVLNRSAYGSPAASVWLMRHGVTVRWAPASPYLHAKMVWTGSTLWIGSMNFSYHGVAINQELSVTVPVPAGYAAWWAALWARSTPA